MIEDGQPGGRRVDEEGSSTSRGEAALQYPATVVILRSDHVKESGTGDMPTMQATKGEVDDE